MPHLLQTATNQVMVNKTASQCCLVVASVSISLSLCVDKAKVTLSLQYFPGVNKLQKCCCADAVDLFNAKA